jgi:hypothetical protein
MIDKRITALDIKKMKDSIKGESPKSSKMQEMLRRKIVEETQAAFETQKIPGLMVKEVLNEQEEKKRIMELTYFASIMAKKLTDNNVGKYHACYVVNAIVNMMGLTEEDFDNFHKKFARFKEGRSGDDENEYD